MEILDPHFLDVVLFIATAFTLLSLVTLLAIIAVRWNADRHLRSTARFRRQAEPLVIQWLTERTFDAETRAILKRYPREAQSLLMEISEKLDPATRPKLRPLFASLSTAPSEISLLTNRHWKVRLNAAEHLGYLGNPNSTDALLATLEDQVLAVRFAAARALVAIGSPRNIEPILLAFDVPAEMNQRRVTEIICEFGEAAIKPLIAVAENPNGKFSDNVICVAVRSLGLLRAPQAVPILCALLKSPEFRIRLNAARALGQIGDRTAQPDLAALSHDPSWEVRNMVVQALGKLHAMPQIPLLTAALGDQSWWVRFSAGEALYSLGDDGINILRTTMRTSSDRFASDMSRQILEEQRINKTMR